MGCDTDQYQDELIDIVEEEDNQQIYNELRQIDFDEDLLNDLIQVKEDNEMQNPQNLDYTDSDKKRCEELNANPQRCFAPPKLRAAKLTYSVGKKIGESAYGVVITGIEHNTGTLVELQQFDLLKYNQQLLEAFHKNIEFTINLKHENIRKIYDIRVIPQQIQVVNEISGTNVFKMVNQFQGLEETIVKKIAYNITKALQYIHSTDVVMQNICLQNVYFGKKVIISNFEAALRRNNIANKRGQVYYACPDFLTLQSQQAGSFIQSISKQTQSQSHNFSVNLLYASKIHNIQQQQQLIQQQQQTINQQSIVSQGPLSIKNSNYDGSKRVDIYALGNLIFQALTSKPVYFQFKEIATLLFYLSSQYSVNFVEYLDNISLDCQLFIHDCLNNQNISQMQAKTLLTNKWFQTFEDDIVDDLIPETKEFSGREYMYKGDQAADSCIKAMLRQNVFTIKKQRKFNIGRIKKRIENIYEPQQHIELFNKGWK